MIKNLIFISLLFPLCALAQTYKWTDDNGKSHFSDKPSNSNAKMIEIKSSKKGTAAIETKVETKTKQDANKKLSTDEKRKYPPP